jgi:hypothetical protein
MNMVKPSDPVNRLASIQSAVAGANQLPQAFAFQKEFDKRWAVASSEPAGKASSAAPRPWGTGPTPNRELKPTAAIKVRSANGPLFHL